MMDTCPPQNHTLPVDQKPFFAPGQGTDPEGLHSFVIFKLYSAGVKDGCFRAPGLCIREIKRKAALNAFRRGERSFPSEDFHVDFSFSRGLYRHFHFGGVHGQGSDPDSVQLDILLSGCP